MSLSDIERLADIKAEYAYAIKHGLPNRISDSDLEWLIEQAEQAADFQYELEVVGEAINSVDNADEINELYLEGMNAEEETD